jgi:transcriptional regulator with XRE-family HTH domain
VWDVGSRIAQVRIRRGKTQAELGVEVGLSPNYISKIERGDRDGLTVETLLTMAGALGVVVKFEAEDDVREQDSVLLLPLRRLLLPVVVVSRGAAGSIDEADLTLTRLRQRVLACTAAYDHAHYAKLATGIPGLVQSIEAAVGLHENETRADIYRLLSETYIITARLLIQLRDESLACEAVRRAMDAAENAGDPVLRASAVQDLNWALCRQMMFDEAETVAVDAAAEIGEPSITKATPDHLAVWGKLVMLASKAAAMNNRPDTADELLSRASSAVARINAARMDYAKYWANFSVSEPAMQRSENALYGGDAPLALHLTKGIPRPGNVRLDAWTYHLACRADAQAATRDYARAIETLKSIRKLAPEWIKNHRVAHDVAIRLLDASTPRRAKSSGLAELAAFMEVKP